MAVTHLAQEFTLLLLDSRLVPHCDLQHALSEVSPMNVGINKGLVPLGLSALFHRFSPSFTLITGREKKSWIHSVCKKENSMFFLLFKIKTIDEEIPVRCSISKNEHNELTSYQAGSTSWRRGFEVVRLVGVAGLWLEGRWQSADGPLCRTTASPVTMHKGS